MPFPEEPQDQNPYAASQAYGTNPAPADPGLLKILFSFEGRSTRTHYWLVTLGWLVVIFVAFGFFAVLGTQTGGDPDGVRGILITAFFFPILIAFFWSNIAITVKRFHDRDKSGWWYCISLVPYIGSFWILIECGFLEGTAGPNTYGDNPRDGSPAPRKELRG